MGQPGHQYLPDTQALPIAMPGPELVQPRVKLKLLGHQMEQNWHIINAFMGERGGRGHIPKSTRTISD
jgi:hypothetical protein